MRKKKKLSSIASKEQIFSSISIVNCLEIELILKKKLESKTEYLLTNSIRKNLDRKYESFFFYTDGSLVERTGNNKSSCTIGARWVQISSMEAEILDTMSIKALQWLSS